MIPNHLSATWAALAPALGNHVWQSTLFAIMAGLLTLMLRKNHARVRYLLWLAASVRFLIPSSLLVGIGSYLPWSQHAAGTKSSFYFAMEEVSQPFTQPTVSTIPQGNASTGLIHLLPTILTALWLFGFLVVIFQWYFRWRRISVAIRKSVRLQEGRELQTLRRLERMGEMRKQTEMLLSRTSLEPGIFGIIRPVLLWPEGISERLEDAHLEAILAHELCHVRRRDNLAAALHMLVEAVFWFHPLVWWLEARMMEERERACDEEVLESGSARQVYAESILKICEFCVGSPLACVSGVTGADLKKRIARIMTGGFVRKLDFSRKLLLSTLAFVAIALPILFGRLQATPARPESQAQSTGAIAPAFEAASIKPNNGTPMAGFSIVGKPFAGIMWKTDRFMATNFTLHKLIQRAYDVQDDQMVGGPDWLNSEGYDIDAKVEKSVVDELQRLGPDQRALQSRRMLQALLADRFKLSLHGETKEVPVYALVIAGNGLKIQRAIPGDTYPNGFKRPDGAPIGAGDWSQPGKFVGQGVPIAPLVQVLSEHYLHRTVLDKTGLTGNYDFTLQWTPDESQAAIFRAIQEQLGLKLESQKDPMQILVIDHAEKPSEPQGQNTPVIPPVFAVASVKPRKGGVGVTSERLLERPDGFTATNLTLQMLIGIAYGVEDHQISGAPNWFNSERYDIEAKMDKSVLDALQKLSGDQRLLQRKRMLQEFLADRFRLTLHRETQHLRVYELVIAQNGPKFQESIPGDTYPNGFKGPDGRVAAGMMRFGVGELTGQAVPVSLLVRELSRELSRELGGSIIEDKTGLKGNYDFKLQWTPGVSQAPTDDQQGVGTSPSGDSSRPSLFAALQKQLGLNLASQNGSGQTLVIDHVERPSEH
jgi:bla regulator protein blaR1